jgi:hypothetical protein
MSPPGTQEKVSPAAGGSAYRDAAEAHLRGAGPPPLTHKRHARLGLLLRKVINDPYSAGRNFLI